MDQNISFHSTFIIMFSKASCIKLIDDGENIGYKVHKIICKKKARTFSYYK